MRLFLYVMLVSSFLLMISCSESEDNGVDSNVMSTLELSFNGLDPLTNGYHYEGWVILDGSPVSTGKFNVDANGNFVNLSGDDISNEFMTPDESDLSDAAAVVITIEPNGDTDTAPASTKMLGGDVSGTSATLTTAHSATLGSDFAMASGKYILATPTSSDTMDENSGIWFLDLSSGSPAVGLDLPMLPDGWAYEGWVVINGTPVTTGRFTDVAAADMDDPYSSTNSGPPFPGEDFVTNAPAGLTFPTDIAGDMAVISIEPDPDDSAAPFTLKPLVQAIPATATDHTTYDMGNNAASFPTGSATIK